MNTATCSARRWSASPTAAPRLCAGRWSPLPPDADRRRHWAHYADGGTRVLTVPGIHGEFHREPQFSAVVAHLRGCLAALD